MSRPKGSEQSTITVKEAEMLQRLSEKPPSMGNTAAMESILRRIEERKKRSLLRPKRQRRYEEQVDWLQVWVNGKLETWPVITIPFTNSKRDKIICTCGRKIERNGFPAHRKSCTKPIEPQHND